MASLRTRLVLVVTAVAATSVLGVALLTSGTSERAFEVFLQQETLGPEEYRIGAQELQRFEEHWRQHGSWIEVAPVLERLTTALGERTAAALVSGTGEVCASAPYTHFESHLEGESSLVFTRDGREQISIQQQPTPIEVGGQVVGRLFLFPAQPRVEGASDAERFRRSIRRWAVVAVALAAVFSLVASFLLVRHMVSPLETLTVAVQRMGQGHLGQEVPVRGTDEIAQLAQAFNQMAAELRGTEQLRRNQVNDVAHELRTPLTNIRCQIEAFQDGVLSPSPENLSALQGDVVVLQRLVDDLETLARADAGRLALEREPCDLGEEARRVVRAFEQQIGADRLRLEVAGGAVVSADIVRVRQVLNNLVDNALRHAPVDSQVCIMIQGQEGEVEIRVADRGPGIPASDLGRIFERFYRTDPSRSRATGGAGLGLAIVKRLVEAHGGRIHAESEPGQGATFVVRLPGPA